MRVGRVVDHAERKVVDPRLVPCHQLLERLAAPVADLFNEPPVIRLRFRAAVEWISIGATLAAFRRN